MRTLWISLFTVSRIFCYYVELVVSPLGLVSSNLAIDGIGPRTNPLMSVPSVDPQQSPLGDFWVEVFGLQKVLVVLCAVNLFPIEQSVPCKSSLVMDRTKLFWETENLGRSKNYPNWALRVRIIMNEKDVREDVITNPSALVDDDCRKEIQHKSIVSGYNKTCDDPYYSQVWRWPSWILSFGFYLKNSHECRAIQRRILLTCKLCALWGHGQWQ